MTTRRDFLISSGAFSILGLMTWRSPGTLWQLISPTAVAQSQTGPAEFKDLYVRSIGFQDVLTAAQWQAGQPVTLSKTIEPSSHGHTVIIPVEAITRLSMGQDATFSSQRAQGHEHQVTIKLRDVVPGGNVIPNKPSIAETPPPSQNPGNQEAPTSPMSPSNSSDQSLAAILGEGQHPHLYVEALQPIDSSTIYYCIGDRNSCSRADWMNMEAAHIFPGRRIYRSKYPLQLNSNDIVHVSALDISGVRRELHAQVFPASNGLYLSQK